MLKTFVRYKTALMTSS